MYSENLKPFTNKAPEYDRTLCCIAAEVVKIVVPHSLKDRVLDLGHYANLAGHLRRRKLYKIERRHFYWTTNA